MKTITVMLSLLFAVLPTQAEIPCIVDTSDQRGSTLFKRNNKEVPNRELYVETLTLKCYDKYKFC